MQNGCINYVQSRINPVFDYQLHKQQTNKAPVLQKSMRLKVNTGAGGIISKCFISEIILQREILKIRFK